MKKKKVRQPVNVNGTKHEVHVRTPNGWLQERRQIAARGSLTMENRSSWCKLSIRRLCKTGTVALIPRMGYLAVTFAYPEAGPFGKI
jgi:hypothetical protein